MTTPVIPPAITKELTKIDGEPDYPKMTVLRREIYGNAIAHHSLRGGGTHGHLGMIEPPAEYLLHNGHAFIAPAHPGLLPPPNPNATAAQINEAYRQYLLDVSEFTNYHTIGETLKQMILRAVDDEYLAILADDTMGYADVTCAEMLAHLFATYSTVSADDIQANRDSLSNEWNPDDSLESLFKRIQVAQKFATAHNDTISDKAAINQTLLAIEATKLFTTACEKWRDKDEATQTMANFQAHFTKAKKERRRQLTAQTAGYHSANATTSTPIPPTAPAHPPTTVANRFGSVMYYCWSCGYGYSKNHTSETCRSKKPGHQDGATCRQTMNGTMTIADSRNRSRS
jgi:hypothetical protein